MFENLELLVRAGDFSESSLHDQHLYLQQSSTHLHSARILPYTALNALRAPFSCTMVILVDTWPIDMPP